jgi:hypothetical protein
MDSLPTGATQSWLIVAAVGLSPMLVFFLARVIRQFLRRKWSERQSGGVAARQVPRFEVPPGRGQRRVTRCQSLASYLIPRQQRQDPQRRDWGAPPIIPP